MRPIPPKIREEISKDPYMKSCIYRAINRHRECDGRVEWEHAFLYKGTQINEAWNIIPVCTYHHRGAGLNKEYNYFIAINRADIDDLERRMPRKNWRQIKEYLNQKYAKGQCKTNVSESNVERAKKQNARISRIRKRAVL